MSPCPRVRAMVRVRVKRARFRMRIGDRVKLSKGLQLGLD